MKVLKNIHQHKTRISLRNQPLFSKELEALDVTLKNCEDQQNHPFNLNNNSRKKLLNCCKDYAKGGQRNELAVDVKHQYLYRYVAINSLLKHPNWLDNVVDKEDAFDQLKAKVKSGDWYNLGKAMTGLYNNRRGFSWWTDIFPDNVEKLYALGIPSDWIFPESVILRIDIKKNNDLVVKMPSAIDGYDSPIFDTQAYNSKNAGKTLNLNDKTDFSDGLNEYVIGEIDTKLIDLVPVLFEPNYPKIMLHDIFNNLHSFYKNK